MPKPKRKGNSGKAGTRAKKAAERRREKKMDAVFVAAVGAGFGAGSYIVGHLIEYMLQPYAKSAAEIILHAFNSDPFRQQKVLEELNALPESEKRRQDAEIRALRGPVRKTLLANSDKLAVYAVTRGKQSLHNEHTFRDKQGESELVALMYRLTDTQLVHVPGVKAKLRHLESAMNTSMSSSWAYYKVPGDPPRFRL